MRPTRHPWPAPSLPVSTPPPNHPTTIVSPMCLCRHDQLYMYICVCIYVYVYMCMYICVCMYVYVYMCMYICVCIYVYVYMCMYICTCAQNTIQIQDTRYKIQKTYKTYSVCGRVAWQETRVSGGGLVVECVLLLECVLIIPVREHIQEVPPVLGLRLGESGP